MMAIIMNESRIRRALRAFFVPLASLLLRNGMTASVVIEDLKLAFVVAARKEFGSNDKPASISKISKLTGMSRRHVSTLVNSPSKLELDQSSAEVYESAILSNWTNSSEYVDKFGVPRTLDIGPGAGTFDELVKTMAGEGHREFYLRRLAESDSICVKDGRVSIKSRAIVGRNDLARLIELFVLPLTTNLCRLFQKPRDDGFVLRAAHTSRIDPTLLGVVRRTTRERVVRFIEDVDDSLTSLETDSGSKPVNEDGAEVTRLGVVAFYFELDEDS
jgi:hypothetical protein